MGRQAFLEKLKSSVVLFDGGLGTEIYNRGVFINKCYEELNLSNPTLVEQIHRDYRDAGADVLETNTFGANRFKLKRHMLADKADAINRRGAEIARKVAGDELYVAASIGPLGIQIEPLGPTSEGEARQYFQEQLRPMVEAGADLIIFETFIYMNELKQAVKAAREICDLPVIAQITIDENGSPLTGEVPDALLASEFERISPDIIGVNCTVGPQVMLQWLERFRRLTDIPLSVMPNAGKPKNIDGRNIYLTSPEYMGEYSRHFIKAGANVIGGCCGTGPEHIRKMRGFISSVKPDFGRIKFNKEDLKHDKGSQPVPRERKSRLARRMADGHFVSFVELLAPHGVYAGKQIEKARELFYYGIDVINIPDGPRASARMSALALALLFQKEVGIETVLHYVCRDRNVIGIQSDLLGAYALGIRNLLAITGDPPKLGNYPDATGVFDVDSIGLVNIINRLNHGLDIAGNPIGSNTGYYTGVGANPGAVNIDDELDRLKWKIDAGAEYVITQPVFDPKQFYSFIDMTAHFNIPIVAGLWPLTSIRNAEFMNNEIPGCHVPDNILNRLRKFESSKEDSLKQGIDIARETLEDIKGAIRGIQISAPFGRVQSVFDVLNVIK